MKSISHTSKTLEDKKERVEFEIQQILERNGALCLNMTKDFVENVFNPIPSERNQTDQET